MNNKLFGKRIIIAISFVFVLLVFLMILLNLFVIRTNYIPDELGVAYEKYKPQDYLGEFTDQFRYMPKEHEDGTVTAEIASYRGDENIVEIPNNIEGLTVITIGNSSFINQQQITAVKINAFAFTDCVNLKKIFIPASVVNIRQDVFLNVKTVIIYGEKGSYAEAYANKEGIDFKEASEW